MSANKTIGGINVTISATTTPFAKGIAAARKQLTGFQSAVAKTQLGLKSLAVGLAGGATIGAMAAFTKNGIEQIGALADLSDKLGISTERLAGYQIAAEDSSVSASVFEKSILRMTKGISDATAGVGTAAKAYEKLGLSVEQLNKLAPDEQFLAISDAMRGVTGQNEKLNLTMELFGARGSDIIRMLDQGREGMKKFQQQADELGLSVKDGVARQVEAAGDTLAKFERSLKQFQINAAIIATPGINAANEAFEGTQLNRGDMTQYVKRLGVSAAGWLPTLMTGGAAQPLRVPGLDNRSNPFATDGLFDNRNVKTPVIDRKALEAVAAADLRAKIAKEGPLFTDAFKSFARNQLGVVDMAKGMANLQPTMLQRGWWAGMQAMQGMDFVKTAERTSVARRPALAFAESGSVESYRQQAAIRKQSENISKKQLTAQQSMLGELKEINRKTQVLQPLNLRG